MDENYISRQICVFKTNKALIEANDKLNFASTQNYAHIHASGEIDEESGRKTYSRIGIEMRDYSKGTGDQLIKVSANLTHQDIDYLYCVIARGEKIFNFEQCKIFALSPDKQSCKFTRLHIRRFIREQKEGEKPQERFWEISIENGTATPVELKSGGRYGKDFQVGAKVAIYLTDQEYHDFIYSIHLYCWAWAITISSTLIAEGKAALFTRMAETSAAEEDTSPMDQDAA